LTAKRYVNTLNGVRWQDWINASLFIAYG
jgi:hypothetical protein